MERLIVDRIEEGFAVLEKEDMSHMTLTLASLDIPLYEGDILLFDGKKYIKDVQEKQARKDKLLLMQQKLKEKSKNK